MKPGSILIAGVLTLVVCISANAQKSSTFIKAGVNFPSVNVPDGSGIDEGKMIVGFHVGVQADFPIARVLSIQPGLFLTTKGSKLQTGQPSNSLYWKATATPWYVEVPVNIVFKAPIGEQSKFFVGAGPYIALGVAGKNKRIYKVSGAEYSDSKNIEWSNDGRTNDVLDDIGFPGLKRFDYGVNGTVGVEGNLAIVSANYGYGLSDLRSDSKYKNRVISISVGFKL